METKSESEAKKIQEICQATGLSEFSLSVYVSMTDKTNPLKLTNLFRIICPNREGIRSLSSEKIKAFEASAIEVKDEEEEGSPMITTTTTTTTTTKRSKKSSDDWRRCIIRAREAEIIENGIKIGGTNETKKMPPRQKELQLIWEFLGWGQTSANFYVYLYYIGPENKGKDFIELTRIENWHIVPESHLILFHKYMGDAHNFFQQSPLSVKEGTGNNVHIEYDVRHILNKWKGGSKAIRKEHIALVNANRALFEHKSTMRTKYDTKRALEIDDGATSNEENEKKKVKRTKKVAPVTPKEYEVKSEKYRRVIIDEYLDITRYPLGKDTMTFDVGDLDILLRNAITDPSRKPASYKWDPTEKIVKPWMIASSLIRLRKQIVQTILKKYNLCFESSDFDAIYYFICNNKEAADDIRHHFDQFTWSYMLFNMLTMRGFVSDEIANMLTKEAKSDEKAQRKREKREKKEADEEKRNDSEKEHKKTKKAKK